MVRPLGLLSNAWAVCSLLAGSVQGAWGLAERTTPVCSRPSGHYGASRGCLAVCPGRVAAAGHTLDPE